MAASPASVLFARGAVARIVVTDGPLDHQSPGFFFVARSPDPIQTDGRPPHVSLNWVPGAHVPLPQLPTFLLAAAAAGPRILNQDNTLDPCESNLDACGALAAPLDDIQSVKLSATLTLDKEVEICITSFVFTLQNGISWPELWMGAVAPELHPPTVDETIQLLRAWLRHVGRDLVGCDVPGIFFLSDYIIPQSRWPESLPQPPENSVIFRAGAYGMGVVSSIVGKPIANRIEDAGWSMLENFAKVTVFAKTKTTQALEHPLARPFLPLLPEQVRSFFLNSAEAKALVNEYDSAGQFLARFAAEFQSRLGARSHNTSDASGQTQDNTVKDQSRSFAVICGDYPSHFCGKPLTAEDVDQLIDKYGSIDRCWNIICMSVFSGGVEPAMRKKIWPLLLCPQDPKNSTSGQQVAHARQKETYELFDRLWKDTVSSTLETALHDPVAQSAPVGDENENLDLVSKVRERKHRIEKDVIRTDRNSDYYSEVAESHETFAGLPAGPNLCALRNILMAYTMYNFELGYVQGMSDLCAPMLAVIDDESSAFWCFVGWMEKMKSHFARDQSGMKAELRKTELLLKLVDQPLYRHMERTDSANMFCCFRWLLISFKREFPFHDIMALWEVMWACPLTSQYHIFVAVAILNMYRDDLFQQNGFDEVLKYVNGLSDQIPIPDVLQHSEVIFWLARDLFLRFAPGELVEKVHADTEFLYRVSGIAGDTDGGNHGDSSERPSQPLTVEFDESWKEDTASLSMKDWEDLYTLFETQPKK